MFFAKLINKMFFSLFTVILFINQVALQQHYGKRLNRSSRDVHKVSFDHFYKYSEIQSYIRFLCATYPTRIKYENFGVTEEHHSITYIKISSNTNLQNRPTILIDAGIHAREWIAPAVALYFIHKLAEDKDYAYLTHTIDWIIVPVLNPDGYIYTHQSPKHRMWRKNRSKGRRCVGVDLNRNFDFHWMEKDSSSDSCTENYAGPAPFSEKESQALRSLFQTYKNQIKLYVTLHSFGGYILYPWSYSSRIPDNDKEFSYLVNITARSIENIRGTKYTVGRSSKAFGLVSGVSDDWAAGVMGVPLAFTIELPRGGQIGFDPPARDILPVAKETFAGLITLHNYIAQKYGTRRWAPTEN